MKRFLTLIPAVLVMISLVFSNAQAENQYLKGKTLLKEDAGKAYLFGEYEKALESLKQKKSLSHSEKFLEAKILYHLGRFQEAKGVFEALPDKQRNASFSQFWLANTLYQLQDKEGAKLIWSHLSKDDSAIGRMSAVHLDALAKGKAISTLTPKKSNLTEENFLKSAGAQFYKSKQYATALSEFQKLATQYPTDALVDRYIGMTQMKLEQNEQAIQTFEEALAKNPWNAALHMELAKAYKEVKMSDESKREYEFVRDYDDSGLYSVPAEQALKGKSKKKSKRYKIRGGAGWQWANNIKGVSEVPKRRKPGDRNAAKYRYNLGGVYELWKYKKWEFNLDGALDHSYFDDGFNDKNTYVHGVGLSIAYKTKLWDKPLKYLLRQGETHTIKKRGFFSFDNSTTFAVNYEPSKHYEFDIYNRWGYTKFDFHGGARKDIIGKDGFHEKVGIKQKYTPTKNKDFFFSLDTAYINARPVGDNGRFDALEVTPGVEFPFFLETIAAFSATYKRDDYPKFDFPANVPVRKGNTLGLDASIEKEITKIITLVGTYAYDNVSDNNPTYRKTNHTFGTALKFKI
jgi:TolA-binding protein